MDEEIEAARTAANQAVVKVEEELEQFRYETANMDALAAHARNTDRQSPLTTKEESRIKKYPELKSIAFELKEKLVRRTKYVLAKSRRVAYS